jgi:hypothetical protein
MPWQLIIKSVYGEHAVPIAGAEAEAREALADAERLLAGTAIVRIAERLSLRAEDITAAQIVERHLFPDGHRRGTRRRP